MHPLSMFPELLNFGLIGPLLLRVVASIFIFFIGWERYGKYKDWTVVISVASLIFGILILLGLYTQLSAVFAILTLKTDFWINKKSSPLSKDRMMLYGIVTIILLSLLVTGPGFLAFDLPL